MQILVAEDEDGDFMLLERAFHKSGGVISVQRVWNGAQLIQYLKGEGEYSDRDRYPVPQMLLLDLKMPEVSGMDVLRWLRGNPRFQVIPTLVMSSSERPEDVLEAYRSGANTYFVKPRTFEMLVELCRQITSYWSCGSKPKLSG